MICPAEPLPNARDLRLLSRIELTSPVRTQLLKPRPSCQNLPSLLLLSLQRPRRRRRVQSERGHERRKCSCRTSRRSMAMKVSFSLPSRILYGELRHSRDHFYQLSGKHFWATARKWSFERYAQPILRALLGCLLTSVVQRVPRMTSAVAATSQTLLTALRRTLVLPRPLAPIITRIPTRCLNNHFSRHGASPITSLTSNQCCPRTCLDPLKYARSARQRTDQTVPACRNGASRLNGRVSVRVSEI